jgi:hypothetical protein
VAHTDGTYATSLALDARGNPAVSFGDGYYYGNLMYATRIGSGWNVEKVDNGGDLGNVGHYSSLVIDPAGIGHVKVRDIAIDVEGNGPRHLTAPFVAAGGVILDNDYARLKIDRVEGRAFLDGENQLPASNVRI